MHVTDVMKYGQLTILHTFNEFPKEAMNLPGACGVWSVKDIMAHLASNELVLVAVLAPFAGENGDPYLNLYLTQGSEFNDAEVAKRSGNSIEEVLTEFNQAHSQAMKLLAHIPQDKLRQAGTLPWYGAEYDLEDFITYGTYGHKREHSAQIAAFKDILGRENTAKTNS